MSADASTSDDDEPLARAVALATAAQESLAEGEPGEALAAGEEAVELLAAIQGRASADVAYVLLLCSRGHAGLGELEAAVAAADEASAIAGRLPGGDEIVDRLRVQTRQRLGQALLARGDYPGARGALEAALADAEDVLAPGDLDIATLLNDLGMIGKYDGRFDDAAAHYARALPLARALGEEGMVATLHHNLAGLAHSRGDYAGAEPHARRAVELNAALRGADHPRVAGDEGELGEILAALGEIDEAEALVRGAAAKFAAAYGPEHVECAIARTSLGSILHRAGRPAEAEVEYRAGLAVREALTGREHPELAPTLINLATLLAERGDADEAEALFRRALGVMDGRVTADHPRRVVCVQRLADLLESTGRATRARELRATIPA